MGLRVTWAWNLGINSSASPCHSPHSQTVISSCKSSLHNCSWTCTFLTFPLPTAWSRCPVFLSWNLQKVPLQLSCHSLSPLSSVFYSAARLFVLRLSPDCEIATWWGALEWNPEPALTCYGILGKIHHLSRCGAPLLEVRGWTRFSDIHCLPTASKKQF